MKNNKIKKLRLQQKLTQQQVAEYCNISLRTYQYIENGELQGSITVWQQLSKIFNTTIDYLLQQEADDEILQDNDTTNS